MLELLTPISTGSISAFAYRQGPPIARKADVSAPPWPYAVAGTGGEHFIQFARQPIGYPLATQGGEQSETTPPAPHVRQMQQVKAGFGRTMSRLPEVFGVSRQTLYNWLNGEMPKEAHLGRLHELAEAAAVFSAHGFKPTSVALDRALGQGKSFLQLLAQGEGGKATATKLIRVSQRGDAAKAKLDALLGGRKARPGAEDIGTPSFREDV